jgi:hypothetical protein
MASGAQVADATGPRPRLRGLGVALIAVFAVVAIVVAATAQAGLWWVPFPVGVLAGLATRRWRRVVLVTVAAAVAGWGLPLWIMALLGYPSGATARAIAGFAGLPPYAAVMVVITLLLAALQVLAGAWLARALAPRPDPAP